MCCLWVIWGTVRLVCTYGLATKTISKAAYLLDGIGPDVTFLFVMITTSWAAIRVWVSGLDIVARGGFGQMKETDNKKGTATDDEVNANDSGALTTEVKYRRWRFRQYCALNSHTAHRFCIWAANGHQNLDDQSCPGSDIFGNRASMKYQ
jgi:hypothetical protein